jgi:prepilin-type N-terminal cleavage/methylation domain-containing protein/prepilin-type processing-associated H-X9-DG protein
VTQDVELKCANNTRAARGFSLVETLVVVAIISLLVALILPGLSWLREASKRAVCESNQKQLCLGAIQYAQNNNGLLIPALTAPAAWVNPGNDAYAMASGLIFKYVNAGNDLSNQSQASIDANPPRSIKVFVCPSDFVLTNIRTYSINSFMNGWEGGSLPAVTRLAQVTRPSSTFYFIDEYDNRGFNLNGFEVNTIGGPWRDYWIDVPGHFHLDGNNISYADGHVEWWAWGDPRTLAMLPGQFYMYSPGNQDLYRLEGVLGN